MYIAVFGYKKTGNIVVLILPVAVFILSGYNHCVADMFYIQMGMTQWSDFISLIPTTIGNLIGACMIPLGVKAQSYLRIR